MTSQPGWQNNCKLQIFATASSKEFLDIQATIECGLTLKCIRDMTRTYIQMHHTDKYSEHSSIIYFRFRACFEKDVPWNLGNYRMWIHCETVDIQSIVIHILPNISRSKGNKAIKFGQLIEYNMKNIFLEKLCTKYGGQTSPRLFPGKLKLSKSLDQ